MSELVCREDGRRREIRRRGLNGLDYVEVSDDQLTLTVTFLEKAPDEIDVANVRIDGGRRVTGIRVVSVRLCREDDPDLDDCMQVTVDRRGDFSTYTIRLVDAADPAQPLDGMDPRYASLQFSFKVGCPTDLDCEDDQPCPVELPPEPDISYLAKDYASFRSLILDRFAVITPEWTERHVPDIGVALVELLAYVGDQLSYKQDAVATEAYLDTARLRRSVRRHVRLVDYTLHDGCNARAWVCVEVDTAASLDPRTVCFVAPAEPTAFPPGALGCDELRLLQRGGGAIYEPVGAFDGCEPHPPGRLRFDPNHNVISFWTWGDQSCCLPVGSTRATLEDRWIDVGEGEFYDRKRTLSLEPGDVLVFEERIGPETGNPADADPTHRQAVRLTSVTPGADPLYDQPIVEVEWALEDALVFPLCISSFAGPDCASIDDVSVVCGNVVLVDHGATVAWCEGGGESLPPRTAHEPDPSCVGPCDPGERLPEPDPYGPILRRAPVTQVTPFPDPRALAGRQAELVAAVPALVYARLDALLDGLRAGTRLDDGARAELTTLFGSRVIADSGVLRAADVDAESDAVGRLVARADHLLADKEERTLALADRARDGDVLPGIVGEELTELWGELYAVPLDGPTLFGPAAGVLVQDPRGALPALWIEEGGQSREGDDDEPVVGCWAPRHDLLHSGPADRHVVGETDDDGTMHLRFGPGVRQVPVGAPMTAKYRVGNGSAGNVGPEAISKLVVKVGADISVVRVRNPLPASGGVDPETVAYARLAAPTAFRHVLERAVTADDYATLAGQVRGVQRAAARIRWTGSWFEADVGLDPVAAAARPERLPGDVLTRLEPARRLGQDLRVGNAVPTPLDVGVTVCVAAEARADVVRDAVLAVLSDRTLPDGRLGFFHPDRLSFATGIAVSDLVAAVQAVPGVDEVIVTRLSRLYGGDDLPADGVLAFGPLEIPELGRDRNDPGRGSLTVTVKGGR